MKVLLGIGLGLLLAKNSSTQTVLIDSDRDGDYSIETGGQDCDDHNPLIHSRQVEDCNTPYDDNCDNDLNGLDAIGCTVYFQDQDTDGFGAANSQACYCHPTSHFTASNKDDCFDYNPEVYPGQDQFFETERGDGLFDFDCDSNITTLDNTQGMCEFSTWDMGCVVSQSGWVNLSPPACGESGEVIEKASDCVYEMSGFPWDWGCYPQSQTVVAQRCR